MYTVWYLHVLWYMVTLCHSSEDLVCDHPALSFLDGMYLLQAS